MTTGRQWPSTIEEALSLLERLLPDERLEELASLPGDALAQLHMGLGAFVREAFGLWEGNDALLCARAPAPGEPPLHPDDAAMLILTRLWLALKARRAGSSLH